MSEEEDFRWEKEISPSETLVIGTITNATAKEVGSPFIEGFGLYLAVWEHVNGRWEQRVLGRLVDEEAARDLSELLEKRTRDSI